MATLAAIPLRIAVIFVILGMTLAACGESSPTSAPTSQAGTSNSGVAQSGITVVLPPTNNAPVGTGGSVLLVPTFPAVTNGAATLPSVNNTTPIQLDQGLLAASVRLVPSSTGATVQILASSDISATLATNVDTTLLGAGYKFVFPGATKPTAQGNSPILGLYSKTNAPDILLSVATVPTDPTLVSRTLNLPTLSKDTAQKFYDQVKDKKSVAMLVAAPNIMQGMAAAIGITPPADLVNATTVAVATANVTPIPAGSVVGEADIPVYPGSSKVQNGLAASGDTTSLYYVSSDDYAKITAWAKQAYTDKGWDGVATNEQAGATVVTGRKGKYSLITTILGPKAHENSGFDTYFKQANAGPNDTVMVVVITH